jgi:hypothetical protein
MRPWGNLASRSSLRGCARIPHGGMLLYRLKIACRFLRVVLGLKGVVNTDCVVFQAGGTCQCLGGPNGGGSTPQESRGFVGVRLGGFGGEATFFGGYGIGGVDSYLISTRLEKKCAADTFLGLRSVFAALGDAGQTFPGQTVSDLLKQAVVRYGSGAVASDWGPCACDKRVSVWPAATTEWTLSLMECGAAGTALLAPVQTSVLVSFATVMSVR